MKRKFIFLAAATAAALTTLASCNKNEGPEGINESALSEIGIRAVGEGSKSAINSTAFPAGYDMLVSAFRNLGSYAGEDVAADYFEGIHFAKDATAGTWKSTQGAKYYPIDGTLDFLAVASAGLNTATNGIVPTAVWGEGSNVAKKVVLTVPDNSVKFDDLLYSSANAQSLSASGTAMTFNHAMTSVVFLLKSNVAYDAATNVGITVNSITIDGAKYSGTLTVSNPAAGGGSGSLSAAWSSLGSPVEHLSTKVWDSANTGVNPSETTFADLNLTTSYKTIASYPFGECYAIMPQQTPVPFTITYTIHNGFKNDGTTKLDNQVEYQYTPAVVDGESNPIYWELGKKNIYSVSINLTEIQIVPSVTDWTANAIDEINFPQ